MTSIIVILFCCACRNNPQEPWWIFFFVSEQERVAQKTRCLCFMAAGLEEKNEPQEPKKNHFHSAVKQCKLFSHYIGHYLSNNGIQKSDHFEDKLLLNPPSIEKKFEGCLVDVTNFDCA